MTLKSENHTLFSRKYPYRPNEGVPPGGGARAFDSCFVIVAQTHNDK